MRLAGSSFLARYRKRAEPMLTSFMSAKLQHAREVGDDPSRAIEGLVRLSRGGKRLRGALMLLGHLISGGRDTTRAVRASLFPEVFHLGLLVQDDVADNDDMRRGEATIHTLFTPRHYGESMALMTGDLTFAWGMELLLSSGFGTQHILDALGEYQRYFEGVVYGQMLDISHSYASGDVREEEIERVMFMKTAEYTAVLPLLAGARLAGEDRSKKLSALRHFGLQLGCAFQIRDDMLGVFGKEKGKPVGSDLREKKQTLLIAHFRSHAEPKERQVFERVWGKKTITKRDLAAVQRVLRDAGSHAYALEQGTSYIAEARAILGAITDDVRLREILDDMLTLVIERVA